MTRILRIDAVEAAELRYGAARAEREYAERQLAGEQAQLNNAKFAERRTALRPGIERKDENDKEPNAKAITEAQRAVKSAIRNP